MNYTEQQAEWITQQILQELATSKKTAAPAAAPVALNIPVGVSNRHVHLCREDMDILFGYGSTLTRSKALKQPGQYAAEALGTKAPVRMSGDLLDSPGIEIIGPKGRVVKHNGMIVAWRHIHISPEEAELHGLHDGMEIDVQTNGPRGGVLSHVVVRVTADAVLELHIDMEEANGVGLRNGDTVRGIKQAARHG